MPAAPTTPPAEDEPQQNVARNDPGTAAVAAQQFEPQQKVACNDPGPDQGRASDPGPDQGRASDPGPDQGRARPCSSRPLPYAKAVMHSETGHIELRAWWDVACRNGPDCSRATARTCYFRHDEEAYNWQVIGEYHLSLSVDLIRN